MWMVLIEAWSEHVGGGHDSGEDILRGTSMIILRG
jgi:hypothetical protein